jgi:3-phosphoglycerate kinase
MQFKTLKDFSVANKRVLVRCDFNVPVDNKGRITDDFKIKKTLPTINYLIESKAKIILMSHLGEPNGEIVPQLNMDRVAEKLSGFLNFSITKENDCIGPEIESITNKMEPGHVLLLENLRFYKEEKEGDIEFAKKLSFLAEIFVNDAFAVSHRNHASITGVPKFLSSCAGLLLEEEISVLNKVTQNPEKPMVAIIGGIKVETKAKVVNKILEIADAVIVSGLIKKEILEKNIQFKYPEKILGPNGNLADLDINEESIKLFKEKILTAKTILWNGPFGKFEEEKYAKGSLAIAEAIIESKGFSVVGGGETVEFLSKQGIIKKFSYVSTGGGAMMTYLSGEKLPGLDALK